MRAWLLPYFLLVSFLIHHSQGARLIQGISLLNRQHEHDPKDKYREFFSWSMNNEGLDKVITSENKHRSGKVRKLKMIPLTTIGKRDKTEHNRDYSKYDVEKPDQNIRSLDENTSVSSSSETYPGSDLDIAGMDYSLATRRPPIHN